MKCISGMIREVLLHPAFAPWLFSQQCLWNYSSTYRWPLSTNNLSFSDSLRGGEVTIKFLWLSIAVNFPWKMCYLRGGVWNRSPLQHGPHMLSPQPESFISTETTKKPQNKTHKNMNTTVCDIEFLLGSRFRSESCKLKRRTLFKKCHYNLQWEIPDPAIFWKVQSQEKVLHKF